MDFVHLAKFRHFSFREKYQCGDASAEKNPEIETMGTGKQEEEIFTKLYARTTSVVR